jgi:cystathionine beta-lyase
MTGQSIRDPEDVDLLRRRRTYKWRQYPPDVLPAWVAEMDYAPDPHVVEAVVTALRRGETGYPAEPATTDLAATVADWCARSFDWAVDPALVVQLPDVVRGLEIAVQWLTPADGAVAVLSPIYPPFLAVPVTAGRRVVQVPLARDGQRYLFDPDALRRAVRAEQVRTLLLCNPHNPSGRVFTDAELRGLAEVAESCDLLVVSDEVHAPLVLGGHRHRPLATLGPEIARRTLTVTSATKAWNFPGLKCAFAVPGSVEAYRRIMALPRRTRTGVGVCGIEATVAALRHGQPWLDRTRARIEAAHRRVAHRLARHGVGVTPVEAGYLAWLDLRSCTGSVEPAGWLLDRARVALAAGGDFGDGGQGHARLTVATPETLLDEILDRLEAAVDRHR